MRSITAAMLSGNDHQCDNQFMIDVYSTEFNAALKRAGDELGLADDYQACVRPLFAMRVQQWPLCCGGRCEPCMQQLIQIAIRICELLDINKDTLGTPLAAR